MSEGEEEAFRSLILLNYTLFTRLTDTAIVRPDCIVALNPYNRDHQQGNMCFNIQLESSNSNVSNLTKSVNALFEQVGCTPRYHIDCFARPSMDRLCQAFEALDYQVEREYDIVMSCDYARIQKYALTEKYQVRRAQLSDLEGLVHLFFTANQYPGTDEWLRKKLNKQINDVDAFRIFAIERDDQIVSSVILFTPSGLPHLGHVSGVATLTSYQHQGLASDCLKQALFETCLPNQRFYLDSYDDLVHAHRMYERCGFQSHGFMETAIVR